MSAPHGASADLERRYRRWLAAFPPAYREARGDEIVGVLLDCAAVGQERPRRAEVVDLLRAGLVVRFRARGRRTSTGWGDAGTVVAILLTVLLCAQGLRFAVFVTRVEAEGRSAALPSDLSGWYVSIAWAILLLGLLTGWTRLAAVAAWIAVAARIVALVTLADVRPAWTVQPIVVQLTLAVVAAGLLSRPRRVRAFVDGVGRVRVLTFAMLVVGAYAVRLSISWAPGTEITLLAVPAALVLLRPARSGPLRSLLTDCTTRRALAIVAALAAVQWFSSNWVRAGGPKRITELDLVLTFAIGLAVFLFAAVSVVAMPGVIRARPFPIVRRPRSAIDEPDHGS